MRQSFLFVAGIAFVCSSGLFGQVAPRASQLNPDRGVVLEDPFAKGLWHMPALDSASHRVWSCSVIRVPKVDGVWTPKQAQIRSLEPVLAKVIAESLSAWPRAPSINDFYRQYMGILVSGHRLIFVNGFHKSYFQHLRGDEQQDRERATFDWRRSPVQVCDGGENYFGALYDPGSGRVLQFGFNGVG